MKNKITEKTSSDLRALLFEEIEALRSGKSSTQQATAISKLATNIINSATLELSVVRMDAGNPAPMKLSGSSNES